MSDKDKILKLVGGTRVKNAWGTADDEPEGASSWKEFYEERRAWPKTCRIKYCGDEAILGAHVTIYGQRGEWIIPMCAKHNNFYNKKWMPVNQGTFAVLEVER